MTLDAKTITMIVSIIAALLSGGGALHTTNERDEILAAALASQERAWNTAIDRCRERGFELRELGRGDKIIPSARSLPAPANLANALLVTPAELQAESKVLE